MAEPKFKFGDPVYSKEICSKGRVAKAGFYGVVRSSFENYRGEHLYTVEDAFGKKWHRDETELSSCS